MKYLSPNINDKRKSQYVAPKLGIDIPYWKKYYSYQKDFYVKLTDGIEGGVDVAHLDKLSPTTWVADYYNYNDLGYYLINDDASEVYEIKSIQAPDEWIQTETNMPESASVTYYIAKYYESLITFPPTTSISTKRYGGLAEIGTINFELSNAYGEANLTDSGTFVTTSCINVGVGNVAKEENIGYTCVLEFPTYNVIRKISNVDEALGYIYFDKAIQDNPYTVIYGYFGGTKASDYSIETDTNINLESYDSLGYHLIGDDETDYGEISDISYIHPVHSIITVPVLVPNTDDFAIVSLTMDVTVIIPNYTSNIIATHPNIEETDISLYLFYGDTPSDTVFKLEDGLEEWHGKVQYMNNIDDSTIKIQAYNKEVYLNKDTIGNLLSESDGVLINGATVESLGEMKPLLFGKSNIFNQLTEDYTLDEQNNNMAKCTYLGLNAETGKKDYLISQNAINEDIVSAISSTSGTLEVGALYIIYTYVASDDFTNVGALTNVTGEVFIATDIAPTVWTQGSTIQRYGYIFYKNSAGRLCRILPSYCDVSSDGSGENVIISIGGEDTYGVATGMIRFQDYWYGTGVGKLVSETSAHTANVANYAALPSSPTSDEQATIYTTTDTGNKYTYVGSTWVIAYDDFGDSVDNDILSYAYANTYAVAGKTSMSIWYNAIFNEYDAVFDSINSVFIYATYALDLVNGLRGGLEKITINSVDALNNASNDIPATRKKFGTGVASKAGISADIQAEFNGSTSGDYFMQIYEIYKDIYVNLDISDMDIEIYVGFEGYKYPATSSWISNRTENDANPNDGFYQYTHSDDDDMGDTIENPIGQIEAVLRDTTFGQSLINSQLDLDAFNRASIVRSTDPWKFVFQVQDQQDTQSFLRSMCEQSSCILYDKNGLASVWAYDDGVPFTNNNMIFDDSRLVADSDILLSEEDFEIEISFKTPSSFPANQATLACSEDASAGDYGVLGVSATAVVLLLDDNAGSSVSYNKAYTIAVSTDYLLKVKKVGTLITYTLNGSVLTSAATAVHNISLKQFGALRAFVANYNFNGSIYCTKIWSGGDRDTGTLECNLESINEKYVDKTGEHYFTKTIDTGGSITFELSDNGIYDSNALTEDNDYLRNPIKEGSFIFAKITDELANKITFNYYKNNDTSNSQTSTTETDTTLSTTIEKELDFDKIADATTIGYIKDIMFATNAKRAYYCEFKSTSYSIDREIFDIINIRHSLLRTAFSNMASKKWIVVGRSLDTKAMEITIKAVELL